MKHIYINTHIYISILIRIYIHIMLYVYTYVSYSSVNVIKGIILQLQFVKE